MRIERPRGQRAGLPADRSAGRRGHRGCDGETAPELQLATDLTGAADREEEKGSGYQFTIQQEESMTNVDPCVCGGCGDDCPCVPGTGCC
jgi:hypothetical protein